MRLFIAEKPSLARAIAGGLGNGKRGNGCITIGDDVVTWCFGHILEQYDPDEYDEKYKKWDMNDLPIVPGTWKLKVKKDAKDQFKVIKELIGKADYIVNAGDPDREGQLLIDEVLAYVGNKKPVKRILLNALDDKSVKEALQDLRSNEDFRGLRDSALGRSRADWLVGMNLTRAYTIQAQHAGYSGALNVGRVKTPTLALVVRREEEIQHFRSTTHYQLQVIWNHENGLIPTTWKFPQDLDGLDEEGRLLDRDTAEGILAKLQSASVIGADSHVKSVEQKKKQEGQRLPYSLSALQIDAGRKYGYSPQTVLDTMQSLYEKKFTTYPRSDCDYLPTNQLADKEAILANLKDIPGVGAFAQKADTGIVSRAWNDKKISAHHAIIPTTVKADFDKLSTEEQNCYLLVAKAYIAQFYPVHTYMATRITVESGEDQFIGNGKQILDLGWKAVYQSDKAKEDEEEDTPTLPEVQQDDPVTFAEGKVLEKQTKPPKRFNPSTLLKAMKEIYKYVKDKDLKTELKECSGIGTEATRAGIIESLQKGGFMTLSKKYLVPTDKGSMAIHALPDEITYPDTTALWEKELEDVSSGSMSLDAFTKSQLEKLHVFLDAAKKKEIAVNKNVPKCPDCGRPMRRRKGKTGFFWGCSGYPACKKTVPDKNGKPDFSARKGGTTGKTAKCPICGKNLRQIHGKFGTFWGCEDRENCNAVFTDYQDKPVILKCPTCGKGYMHRHESKKKKGAFFWSCSDYDCHTFLQDDNGKPGEPFPPRTK